MTDKRKLYQEFQAAFPIESLPEMTLEKYTNLNKEDSFCYWLELKTQELGSIWGGSSYKFAIYEYLNRPDAKDTRIQSDEKYAWYKRLNKPTAQEAFAAVRNSLVKLANFARDQKFSEIEAMSDFGVAYKWKIAFLYSNEGLIPIYKKEMLVELAAHFGMDNADKAKQVDLQEFLLKQKGEQDIYEFYDELLATYNKIQKAPRYWLYSPGSNASKWEWCQENSMMCLGWDEMGDLEQYESKKKVTDDLKRIYGDNSDYRNDSSALWNFVSVMKPGDIIYAKKGIGKIVGRGVVLEDYRFDDSLSDFNHIRKVQWTHVGEWPVEDKNPVKTLTDISASNELVKKLEAMIDDKQQPTERQYWWLVASPKVWKFSELEVNEEQNYTLYNDNGNKRRVFQNFLDAKQGDIVIGYESNPVKQIVALAEVSKPADDQEITFKKTETLLSPINLSDFKDLPELAQMQFLTNPNGSFFKLTDDEYNTLIDIIRDQNPKPKKQTYAPYSETDFLNEVFIDANEFHSLRSLLLRKKNVVLQGAPGVGKTFTAKRLAYSILGQKDTSKVEVVQFHQNYSYEDFIMGYRPNSDGGFVLQPGLFYNFCKRAQNDPTGSYFFIIDEINRGNLSKIFGELLMLVEADYRGQENAIALAYNGEQFFVPKNVYLIGMMNTADRSLAMIDYALRRRFSFFEMTPGFESAGFQKYLKQVDNVKFTALIDGIVALNKTIEGDPTLGSGFCIGHSYFCNNQDTIDAEWLKNVVDYDIAPMLREYWFDDNDKHTTEITKLQNILK